MCKFITAVLGKVQAAHIDDALWIANKAQTDLWHERQTYLKTVDVLLHQSWPPESSGVMNIGEISRETGIPVTTIRYWEKAGLLVPKRNSNNGYRIYTRVHIRQLLTLNAIKLSARTHRLKHFFQTMQQTYQAFDFTDHEAIEAFLEKVRSQLNLMNRLQIRSISALTSYVCRWRVASLTLLGVTSPRWIESLMRRLCSVIPSFLKTSR